MQLQEDGVLKHVPVRHIIGLCAHKRRGFHSYGIQGVDEYSDVGGVRLREDEGTGTCVGIELC